ncbi:sulfotransferase domain-containing protein [Vibrio sp. D404a]|uniref:sulfotransferase domain-containing protein n=1 Tax=unclassified Vibrio TaxID=2614977 RepID=UPI00255308A5|nr:MULTISPECIES: sulfotransferase domain-containing protein [unclassified Vibrio]MDK9737730.1 sulfotransferase domain-containing protein [Vibrio sp. D404a]MDK9795332.1 sulfotransferase domain-containing protein [Vibrio sp. D449a]
MCKVAIHSVPRSGSSWLGEIVNSSPRTKYAFQPLFSYEFKSYLTESSNLDEISSFFSKISVTKDDFVNQKSDRDSGKKPQFRKDCNPDCVVYKEVRYHYIIDNLLTQDKDVKLLALVRNPYSVINSWYNAPREFRKDLGWELKDELINASQKNLGRKEEYFGLQKWSEVVFMFRHLKQKFPNRVYIVSYEDLCINPVSTTEDIYSFLEIDITQQTYDFLNSRDNVEGTYSVIKNTDINALYSTSLQPEVTREISSYLKEVGLSEFIR